MLRRKRRAPLAGSGLHGQCYDGGYAADARRPAIWANNNRHHKCEGKRRDAQMCHGSNIFLGLPRMARIRRLSCRFTLRHMAVEGVQQPEPYRKAAPTGCTASGSYPGQRRPCLAEPQNQVLCAATSLRATAVKVLHLPLTWQNGALRCQRYCLQRWAARYA